jgi:uncharacterized coiled-coil DUF342 family protein
VTYDSVERLKEAIDELREGYKQLRNHLKNRDEPLVDFVEETIGNQSQLIEEIEESDKTRERLKNEASERWPEWMDELESLRDDAESLLRNRLQSVDSEIESLDKNLEMMGKYKQDSENNYFLDEKF